MRVDGNLHLLKYCWSTIHVGGLFGSSLQLVVSLMRLTNQCQPVSLFFSNTSNFSSQWMSGSSYCLHLSWLRSGFNPDTMNLTRPLGWLRNCISTFSPVHNMLFRRYFVEIDMTITRLATRNSKSRNRPCSNSNIAMLIFYPWSVVSRLQHEHPNANSTQRCRLLYRSLYCCPLSRCLSTRSYRATRFAEELSIPQQKVYPI